MAFFLFFIFIYSATQEQVETAGAESGFVEVGYISNVHGLQGEARVKPSTDFPALRFCEVGLIQLVFVETFLWLG